MNRICTINEKLTKFSLAIRYLREEKKLTQREVASCLKVSFRTYQRIEYGQVTPALDFLFKASECYNLPPSRLLNYTLDNDSFESYSEQEFFDLPSTGLLRQLVNSPVFLKIIDSNDLNEIFKFEQFWEADQNLFFSEPTTGRLNRKASTVYRTRKVKLGSTWNNRLKLLSFWNRCIGHSVVYFSTLTEHTVQGSTVVTKSKNVFLRTKTNFIILGNFEST